MKGSSWLPGAAPFKSDVTHQIVFEGIKGDTQTGDIVIRFNYILLNHIRCFIYLYNELMNWK